MGREARTEEALDARSPEAEAPGSTVGRVWSSWLLGDTGSAEGLSLAMESGHVHSQEGSGPGVPVSAVRRGHSPWPPHRLPSPGAILGAPGPILQAGHQFGLRPPSRPSSGLAQSWSDRVPVPPRPSAAHPLLSTSPVQTPLSVSGFSYPFLDKRGA